MTARQLGPIAVCGMLAACAAEPVHQPGGAAGAPPRVAVSVQALTSPPDLGCSSGSFNGHDYWFCSVNQSWQSARTKCQAIGYDLAVIDDAAENQFIRSRVALDAWIGGRDSAVEGAWRWAGSDAQFWQGKANGTAIGGAYTNWSSGQPDDLFNQDCLNFRGTLLGAGRWSDESCGGLRNYVCEGDLCPADPSKTEPGQCGCGVADDDTDGDGTADCNDACPSDPDKAEDEGACGCGVADDDTDEDGALDCSDGCPDDPTKITAGDCGCSDAPEPAGTACGDGLCSANDVCDGAGRCGDPAACGAPDTQCTYDARAGTQYWFCNRERSFAEARQRCQNAGMDLAAIESAGEDAFIGQYTSLGVDLYIGASDAASEGNFSWVATGQQFWTGGLGGSAVAGAYTNWNSLHPANSLLLNADCVVKDRSDLNRWETTLCSSTEHYVCELPLSCAGQCGGYGDGCWCDETCAEFGDCCPDKVEECGEEPPPTEGTCEGQCGGQSGECWCDATCEEFGDCCPDKVEMCGEEPPPLEGTCEGQCGGDAGTCWCDAGCHEFGDCCPDKIALCGDDSEPPPPLEGSCVGLCGGDAGTCFCDAECDEFGDCCPDKVAVCGDDSEPPPGDSCVGLCGGQTATCFCDDACELTGDCCPDKIAVCGGGEPEPPPPTEDGSCEGQCGALAGSCWCDDGCETLGDCCPDKVEQCGASEP